MLNENVFEVSFFKKFKSLTEHQDPYPDRATQFNEDPAEPGSVWAGSCVRAFLLKWPRNICSLVYIWRRTVYGASSRLWRDMTIYLYDAFLLVDIPVSTLQCWFLFICWLIVAGQDSVLLVFLQLNYIYSILQCIDHFSQFFGFLILINCRLSQSEVYFCFFMVYQKCIWCFRYPIGWLYYVTRDTLYMIRDTCGVGSCHDTL